MQWIKLFYYKLRQMKFLVNNKIDEGGDLSPVIGTKEPRVKKAPQNKKQISNK